MNIVVDRLENTQFTYNDVAELLHESFKERLDSGLNMMGSFVDENMLEEMNSRGAIFVAYIEKEQRLVGCNVLTVNEWSDGIFGNHQFVGISSDFKRCGIGGVLFAKLLDYAKSCGCDYLTSTTSVKAKSSIAWHKKIGFKIYKYASYGCTNYFSYIFRMDLTDKSILRLWLPRTALLIASFVITRLSQNEDGDITRLGNVLLRSKLLRRFASV